MVILGFPEASRRGKVVILGFPEASWAQKVAILVILGFLGSESGDSGHSGLPWPDSWSESDDSGLPGPIPGQKVTKSDDSGPIPSESGVKVTILARFRQKVTKVRRLSVGKLGKPGKPEFLPKNRPDSCSE